MRNGIGVVVVVAVFNSAVAHAALPPIVWDEEAGLDARASSLRTKTIVSLSAFGIALACAVAGGIFGGQALGIRQELPQVPVHSRPSLIADGERLRLFSNLGWGLAGVGALVGGLVWAF